MDSTRIVAGHESDLWNQQGLLASEETERHERTNGWVASQVHINKHAPPGITNVSKHPKGAIVPIQSHDKMGPQKDS